MIRIKNVRPNMLLITDAGLVLGPGGVASVETATTEIERAIKTGHLVRLGVPPAGAPAPEPPPVSSDSLAGLTLAEAVARVNAEQDPKRLKTWLNADKRRSVITAIQNKLAGALPDAGAS